MRTEKGRPVPMGSQSACLRPCITPSLLQKNILVHNLRQNNPRQILFCIYNNEQFTQETKKPRQVSCQCLLYFLILEMKQVTVNWDHCRFWGFFCTIKFRESNSQNPYFLDSRNILSKHLHHSLQNTLPWFWFMDKVIHAHKVFCLCVRCNDSFVECI